MDNQTDFKRTNANEWCVFQDKHYEDCLIGIRKIFDEAFMRGYRCGIQEAVAQTYTETPVPKTDHIPEATKKVDRTMIAAMAMQGLLTCDDTRNANTVAEEAVFYANALIEVLKKIRDEQGN